MRMFELLRESAHEQVVWWHDETLGLRCIVAIHNTVLGPALGGLRMWPYASEDEALRDALRLSRGMTYKAAVSGLNLGGGKAVLIGDPETGKSEALLRVLGRHIGALGGRFIVAEDLGTNVDDMEIIREETDCVVGVHEVSGGSGDPSPYTALGALHGIEACLQRRFGHDDLARASYAVQGAGQVGRHLVRLLRERGAKVFVADINDQRIEEVVDESGAEAVPMSQIYDVDATVFAPCAMGAVINEDTVPRLRCAIVAGCANNQLESNRFGTALEERGILYAPGLCHQRRRAHQQCSRAAGLRCRSCVAKSPAHTPGHDTDFRHRRAGGDPDLAGGRPHGRATDPGHFLYATGL
jgi:leucine dehydrogenase